MNMKLVMITLLAGLIAVAGVYAQPAGAEDQYREAARLCVEKNSGLSSEAVIGVVNNGWPAAGDELLRDYLKSNEEACKAVRKAAGLKLCGWAPKEAGIINRKPIPYRQLRSLFRILLLSARYQMKQDKADSAVEEIHALLSLGRALGDDPALISRMIAVALEKMVVPVCRAVFDSGKETEAGKLRKYLDEYVSSRFKPRDIVLGEKEFFLQALELVASGMSDEIQKKYGKNKEILKSAELLSDSFRKHGREKTDELFGEFMKAAEADDEKTWKMVEEKMAAFQKECGSEAVGSQEEIVRMFMGVLEQDQAAVREAIVKKIVHILISIAIPNFYKAHVTAKESLEQLKRLVEKK